MARHIKEVQFNGGTLTYGLMNAGDAFIDGVDMQMLHLEELQALKNVCDELIITYTEDK